MGTEYSRSLICLMEAYYNSTNLLPMSFHDCDLGKTEALGFGQSLVPDLLQIMSHLLGPYFLHLQQDQVVNSGVPSRVQVCHASVCKGLLL
jgi:hypothetical protein